MSENTKERVMKQAEAALKEGFGGVLALCKRWGQVGPFLFTDPKDLKDLEVEPKYCLSKTIRQILERTKDLRLAAVVRGCDARALRQWEKIGQLPADRLRLLGIDCSMEQALECNCEKPIYETTDCTGCWKCLEACPENAVERINPCPIVVPNEWDVGLKQRKAMFIPFPQAVPLKAARDKDHCLKLTERMDCKGCEGVCEADAIDHRQEDEEVTLEVGSIIVATGFEAMNDPEKLKPYGYGRLPNVISNFEFERLSNATGPTSGQILMRDPDNRWAYTRPPASVGILHCIGSRDANYHEYCSRTCCMYALKFAHLIKDKCGHETQIFNFYIDMRCFGKGYEEFYKRVQSEGVRMIRGKAVEVTDKAESPDEEGYLVVKAEDSLTGTLLRIPVEMVILCTAMEARDDAVEVARIFGISTGQEGFFTEEHPKLEPVSTPTSGVFLAGACQGPKDIPDAVAQAKAASSEAQSLSTLGQVVVAPMISGIDPDVCVGCQVCIDLCPYTAIEFDDFKRISVVNEALCKGCGSCAGYCPSGAAKIRHFTDKQIFAEIDGIMASG